MEHPVKKYYAVVIGGVNMDIGGSPAGRLVMRDSNPGLVTLKPGGVGRNIAHDLRLLGLEVSLAAALGGDMYAAAIRESCAAAGLDMSMALVLPERRSSTYLYVTDGTGDMQIGIADMDITKCLTPAYFSPLMERINRADAVVLDANLEAETLVFIAENCTVPLYADPVSTAKAPRLLGALKRLRAIKPNAMEAMALTGEKDPERAALALLERGVEQVFISLGRDGMLAAERGCLLRLPRAEAHVVNTTGAGDAATAAIVWAGVHGMSLERAAAAALRAGAITTECREANHPALSSLGERIEKD